MFSEQLATIRKELCARLPYSVRCYVPTKDKVMTLTGRRLNYFCFHDDNQGLNYCNEHEVVLDPWNSNEVVKPYLRPMSSVSDEERKELEFYRQRHDYGSNCADNLIYEHDLPEYVDYLLEHHLDYRGLIGKGLALEAPAGMYECDKSHSHNGMSSYNTLRYILKGDTVADEAPYLERIDNMYARCEDIPQYLVKGLIDESLTDLEIETAVEAYPTFDIMIDEIAYLVADLITCRNKNQ